MDCFHGLNHLVTESFVIFAENVFNLVKKPLKDLLKDLHKYFPGPMAEIRHVTLSLYFIDLSKEFVTFHRRIDALNNFLKQNLPETF